MICISDVCVIWDGLILVCLQLNAQQDLNKLQKKTTLLRSTFHIFLNIHGENVLAVQPSSA